MKKINRVIALALFLFALGACTLTVTTDGYVYSELSGGYQRR